MGADRTLVEGAYRAAMAKVPGDYSKFYWAQMSSNQQALDKFIKSGKDVMDYMTLLNEETEALGVTQKKKDSEESNRLDKTLTKAAIDFGSLLNGGNQKLFNTKIYDIFNVRADNFRDRMEKASPVNGVDTSEKKKERQHIWGQAQGSVTELKNMGSELLIIAKLNNEKHLSKEGMGGDRAMYQISSVVDFYNGIGNNVSVEDTEEGIVFVVDGSNHIDPLTGEKSKDIDGNQWGKMRITAKNLFNNAIPKARGQQKYYGDIVAENEKQIRILAGKGKESKFDYFGNKDSIKTNMFTDEKAFVDLMHRPWIGMEEGGGMSPRDIWMKNPENYVNTYGSLGVAFANTVGNKDNFITEEDFVLPKDRIKIADALFRPTLADGTPNPNFSWEAGAEAGSTVLTDILQKKDEQFKLENPVEEGGGGGGGTTYKNKKHEWRYNTTVDGKKEVVKGEIWSDDIINTQNELMSLGKSNINSFDNEQTVLIGGQHYGYFKDRGFARVGKSTTGQVQLTVMGRKGAKRLKPGDTPKGGWFKSIAEVLRDAGLPTTYLQYTNTASTGLSKLPGWNK